MSKLARRIGRRFRIIQGVLTHPEPTWRFLKFNYPISDRERSLGFGSIGEMSRRRLTALAARTTDIPGPIVELGSLFGHSAIALVEGKPPEKALICVDCFLWNPYGLSRERHQELLERNLEYFVRNHSVQIRSVSSNHSFFMAWNEDSPSLVFIDAGHGYEDVKSDLTWAINAGAVLICGDDWDMEGVRRAVEEVIRDGEGVNLQVTDGRLWEFERTR